MLSIVVNGQNPVCDLSEDGTYKLANSDDETAYIVLKEGILMDFTKDGEEYVMSSINWIEDCLYQLTLLESNIPGLTVEKGSQHVVEIKLLAADQATCTYISGEPVLAQYSKKKVTKSIPKLEDMAISDVIIF